MPVDWKRRKRQTVESIVAKKVFLHRCKFSGSYTYDDLSARLGKKLGINKAYDKNSRMPNYNTMAYTEHFGLNLTIFLNPIETINAPRCLIELSYPTQEFLMALNLLLPGLKCSSIEYTNDLFYLDATSVRKSFEVFFRYCFVPYLKIPRILSGHSAKYKNSSKVNRTARIDPVKIYERGADKKGPHKGWTQRKLDRIRIEFTARRELLKRKDIYELEKFIADCKYSEIVPKSYSFSLFTGNQRLPCETDTYALIEGHESFQLEYIRAFDDEIKNPYQYKNDAKVLNRLKRELDQLAIQFDQKWRHRSKM
jgi:hypothetical protein